MNYIRKIIRALNGSAPLNNFNDYDEYWQMRTNNQTLPAILPRYKIISNIIPNGASVLDIGCGNGSFLKYLISIKPDCHVTGVDISADVVKRLIEQGIPAKEVMQTVPLNEQFDQSFDYVVMMEVIEHIHDAEAITRQAALLAKQRLFITVPNVGFILHRLRLALFGRFPVTNICCHMKEHIRFWTVTDFSEWAHALRLNLVRTIPQVSKNEHLIVRYLAYKYPSLFAKAVIYELVPDNGASVKNYSDVK